MTSTTRRAALGGLAATLLLPGVARAQAWPSGPVRIVVPFPPGGSVDTITRLLQPHLQSTLGVPIVVENRVGASGALGAAQVARAAADGQTFLHVFDTHVVNPALIPSLGYDPQKDLAPVLRFGIAPMLLAAHRSRPWRGFAEVIAAAKAKPDTITYGTIGNGSLAHLAMVLLQQAAGISLVHVPYRGGGPLVVAATAGEVDLAIGTPSILGQLFEQGTLRALATTGHAQSPLLAGTPTLRALGYPVEAEAFWGALAPGGTPRPILEAYERALREAVAVPAVQARLTGVMGIELDLQSGPAFGTFLTEQMALWTRVVRDNNIRPD